MPACFVVLQPRARTVENPRLSKETRSLVTSRKAVAGKVGWLAAAGRSPLARARFLPATIEAAVVAPSPADAVRDCPGLGSEVDLGDSRCGA